MDKTATLKRILDGARAVIFDFDNVVVDSEPFHYEAYARVFASHGHTIDRDEYWLEWTSKGGGAAKEIKRYELDLDPKEIQAEKDPIYAAFCRDGSV
ncbi:MAG TPA: HAD family phosphatase, partial [Alphaproteobacteria bacterium]|nr:HAD family phosphatase [Alphaproteobacteria bacterium]